MKQKPLVVSMLLLSVSMLGISGLALGDKDSDKESYRRGDKGSRVSGWFSGSKQPGVAPVENPQYLEECGSCHFAYQPGLLPARSWTKMMASLDDHFGENAELPAEDAKMIERYLLENAADHSNYKRSMRIMNSLHPAEAPLRISETPYFIKKHDELSRKMVQDNPQVGSFSKCGACHTQADKGSFEENEIQIPGFGRWEDD